MTSDSISVRPLSDWVVIDRAVSDNITAGGIVLPNQTGRTKPEYGTVIAVGAGAKNEDGNRIPMDVCIGDKVSFRRFDVEKLKGIYHNESNRPYIMIRERDLWGVLEPEDGEKFTVRTVADV